VTGPFPGGITLGGIGLTDTGTVLQPVTAFGVDISRATPGLSFATLIADDSRLKVPLNGPAFLGLVSTTPFLAGVEYVPYIIDLPPVGKVPAFSFTIDNIAIKTVPEPSSFLFLGIGLLALIVWRKKIVLG
jgi:hypothetical protein